MTDTSDSEKQLDRSNETQPHQSFEKASLPEDCPLDRPSNERNNKVLVEYFGSASRSRHPRNYPARQFQFAERLRFASVILSVVTVCLGIGVVWGWVFDLAWLKSVIADRVTMKVSTALSLMSGGFTLLLWHYQQNKQNLAVKDCPISLAQYGDRLLLDRLD